MNNYISRLEQKALEKDNQEFASKKNGFLIFLPCWIPIILAFFLIANGSSEVSPYIMMGSLLALVCGSLSQFRAKIIQQDKALRLLQEKLQEGSSKS